MGRIIVRKTPERKHPAVRLCDVPAKQPENEKPEQVKIVICTRPNKTSSIDVTETGIKQKSLRSVEERVEEYGRARARIFCESNSPEVRVSSQGAADGGSICSIRPETEDNRKIMKEPKKRGVKDGSSRVAIFKDWEKDLCDPDYDWSYERYFRGLVPNKNSNLGLYNVLHHFICDMNQVFLRYDRCHRHRPRVGYKPSNSIMNSFYTAGCDRTSRDSIYMQWPSPSMMYAHSYDHFTSAFLQAPSYQQPLSFEHYQNC